MPAGVSWGTYLKFSFAALLSMFAGAQVLHVYYRPLDDMEILVNEEVQKLKKDFVRAVESGEVKLKTQGSQ